MNYLATTQTAHPSAVLNEDPFANMLLPMDYGLLGYVVSTKTFCTVFKHARGVLAQTR